MHLPGILPCVLGPAILTPVCQVLFAMSCNSSELAWMPFGSRAAMLLQVC